MGIRIGFSSDRYSEEKVITEVIVSPGNPDPRNWEILESLQIDNCLIVEVKYPGCKNYEGRKILVYEGLTIEKLKKQKLIDPHFSENKKYYSPIARFEPTNRGWQMAEVFTKGWKK